MDNQNDSSNIKVKVILGFLVALIVVGAASYITVTSFLRLTNAVEVLSFPDSKLTKINNILTDVSDAENTLRAYSITSNQEYLNTYNELVGKINQNIDTLKYLVSSNTFQMERLDSIESIWKAKSESFREFVELKKVEKNTRFSSKALAEISNQPVDSVEIATTTKRTETIKLTEVPATPKEETTKAPEKGLLNGLITGLRKLVTKKNVAADADNADTVKVKTRTIVTIDTSFVKRVNIDSVLSNVVTILEELQKDEYEIKNELTRKELDFVRRDLSLMSNLRTVIRELQQEELSSSLEQASVARSLAHESIYKVFGIGIIGLFSGLVFLVLIFKDITRSNYYRNQLLKSKRRAEKLAKTKEEFMANMSHEIRTPLNAIIGFSEQMQNMGLAEKQHFFLQAIKNSSEHLLSTVNDILDFSKIEAGQLRFEKIPFDLHEVARQTYDIFVLKAEEKELDFTLDIDPALDRILLGDPFRLRQLLFNLIGNAIKFTEKGKVALIIEQESLKNDLANLKIKVSDTGIGIKPEHLDSIFKGFQQADGSITRKYGGTGLGLAICKKLVELQKGKLEVESKPGEGTDFVVMLSYKLAGKGFELTTEKPAELNVENFRNKNLLVIDDDEYNILLCHTILKRWGIHPDLASNGKEGIRMITDNKYDLILTDVQMPEVSGLELLDFVRQANDSKNQQTPVIVLSANVMPEIKEKFDQKGAHIFVNKPFRELELIQAVAKALHMEEEISEIAEEIPETNGAVNNGFNLDQIRKFAENDPSALIAILEGILQSNQNNYNQLKDFKQKEDWKAIASTAHKMIPSFAHLGAVEISPLLRKLEKSEKLISGQKEKDLKLLLEKLEPILNELKAQLETLKATEKVKV